MVNQVRWRMIDGVRRVLWTDASRSLPTEVLSVVDESTVVRVIDLAMRVGDVMLAVGAPSKEVTLAVLRITGAYGLKGTQVNVTYNSIMVSDHRGDHERPVTLMRVVKAAEPDHAKLQRLQALVTDIEDGLGLDEARESFRSIRRTPFLYRSTAVVVAQAILAVGVGLMYGSSLVELAVIFIAALGVAVVQRALTRLRVPMFFSQISGALVLTIIAAVATLLARNGVEPFTGLRPTVVVASGIVLMLAGLTVVGAAQDAIDGFALTAGGRILELIVLTLGVVLGVVVGLQVASALNAGIPMPNTAMPFGTVPGQVAGAVLVAITVAIMNGAGLRIVVVSAALGLLASIGFALALGIGANAAAASFVSALAASVVGALVAHPLHVPSVAVTTAAIVPLVPGSAVFRGLLGLVEAGDNTAALIAASQTLVSAGMIGVALAAGATLGLFVGAPLRATRGGVTRRVRTIGR